MLPRERFLLGLASFALAHASYCVAFVAGVRWAGFQWIVLVPMLIGAWMLWYIWPGLTPRLRVPASIYTLVIVAMASLAGYRLAVVGSSGALAAGVGAALFLCSDAVLAINRFRRPFVLAQAVVLGTYFAAQILIALSVGL
jgi:uncharacterized membrane protein YhhN